ncbi:MAG: sulfurtransferase [Nocardioidaceae bacterium]
MAEETLLISARELAARLDAGDDLLLWDVRWSPQGPTSLQRYESGHLPGATYVDLDHDLAAPPGPTGRHPLPDTATFQEAARRLGVHNHVAVVVYDQRDATIAARAWWMLRYFGHRDVLVLDGGVDAWVAAGGGIETGPPAPVAAGDFDAVPGGMRLIEADAVPALADRGMLLDSRLGERYRGEVEPLDPVAGHIPGAISAPTFDNSLPDGRFRPPGELRERFTALGVTDRTEIGAYCGSGVTAAHQVLALRLAGYDAGLYAGSWSEWIADPEREIATGPS